MRCYHFLPAVVLLLMSSLASAQTSTIRTPDGYQLSLPADAEFVCTYYQPIRRVVDTLAPGCTGRSSQWWVADGPPTEGAGAADLFYRWRSWTLPGATYQQRAFYSVSTPLSSPNPQFFEPSQVLTLSPHGIASLGGALRPRVGYYGEGGGGSDTRFYCPSFENCGNVPGVWMMEYAGWRSVKTDTSVTVYVSPSYKICIHPTDVNDNEFLSAGSESDEFIWFRLDLVEYSNALGGGELDPECCERIINAIQALQAVVQQIRDAVAPADGTEPSHVWSVDEGEMAKRASDVESRLITVPPLTVDAERASGSSAPVWAFTVPFSTISIGGAMSLPDQTFRCDFAPVAPYRLVIHGIVLCLVSIRMLLRVWEELRIY